ncbi:hypothetical protein BHE74_00035018 [Ensete ventricosum]|nr:hypothetical protein GW17_00036354 [Ensete ventricosum]RWW58150.1 hypothetical protein BHE74_00035018 [Ensete ventricosum]RZR93429.1 hypothetical protein BHM03_00021946 [Ensete ventricosum]
MSGLYTHSFSPARVASPQIRTTSDVDRLLICLNNKGAVLEAENLINCLLTEIMRVSGMVSNQGFGDYNQLHHRSPSPMAPSTLISNSGVTGYGGRSGLPQEFNFIGRLLGPRGNSLKRVEASTGCRVYIRGKGSIKDLGQVSKSTQLSSLW